MQEKLDDGRHISCMHSKKMKEMKEAVTLTVGGNCGGWRRKELKRGI